MPQKTVQLMALLASALLVSAALWYQWQAGEVKTSLLFPTSKLSEVLKNRGPSTPLGGGQKNEKSDQVLSPLLKRADTDADGEYTSVDLLQLFRDWESYGDQSLQVLATVLSEYQEIPSSSASP